MPISFVRTRVVPLFSGSNSSAAAYLVRGVSGTFGLQVFGLIFSLASSVMLARALGTSNYGIYAYALAWLEFLKIPVAYGIGGLIARELAIFSARNDWAPARGLLTRSSQFVLAGSAVLMIGMYALLECGALKGFELPAKRQTMMVALLLLPLLALSGVRTGALLGLHRPVASYVPETVIRPVGMALIVGIIWLVLGHQVDARVAMLSQLAAVAIAFLVGAGVLVRTLPSTLATIRPVYRSRMWFHEALPYLLHGGAWTVWGQISIIALGWYAASDQVGIYRVVSLLAALTVMPAQGLGSALSPMIARMYSAGERTKLQSLIARSSLLTTAFAAIGFLAYVVLGKWVLSHVFGPSYVAGYATLLVMAAQNCLFAGMFATGLVLDYTGNQRYPAIGYVLAASLNVILAIVLIPRFGVIGAGISNSLSWLLGHSWLIVVSIRRVGVNPTVLGILWRHKA